MFLQQLLMQCIQKSVVLEYGNHKTATAKKTFLLLLLLGSPLLFKTENLLKAVFDLQALIPKLAVHYIVFSVTCLKCAINFIIYLFLINLSVYVVLFFKVTSILTSDVCERNHFQKLFQNRKLRRA